MALAAASSAAVSVRLRPSSTRGHADHGWLNSYHTFSFADWYDPRYQQLHALRVINEDRVAGGRGFGRHPHREFEIFSYVVSGALKHTDSMGHVESLGRGAVQLTSAGTGIQHAEQNASPIELVHFIQIWVKPDTSGLAPSYDSKTWSDADKLNQLRLIVSKDGREGSIRIHQDVSVFASILAPGASVSYDVQPGRELYVHLIQDVKSFDKEHGRTGITVGTAIAEGEWAAGAQKLAGGDGATISHSGGGAAAGPQRVTLTGAGVDGSNAELILFDLKKE